MNCQFSTLPRIKLHVCENEKSRISREKNSVNDSFLRAALITPNLQLCCIVLLDVVFLFIINKRFKNMQRMFSKKVNFLLVFCKLWLCFMLRRSQRHRRSLICGSFICCPLFSTTRTALFLYQTASESFQTEFPRGQRAVLCQVM